jgi:hypothetical protein
VGAGQFFGGLLIICGMLMVLLCGLCTLAVIGASVATPATHDPQSYGGGAMIPVALLFGGVPTVFGGLVVWAGVAIFRGPRKPRSPPSPPPAP